MYDRRMSMRAAAFLDALLRTLFAAIKPRASLVAENLALRQQLAVLKRATHVDSRAPAERAIRTISS